MKEVKIEKITVVPVDASAKLSKEKKPDYAVKQWGVGMFTDKGFLTGAEFLGLWVEAGKATGDEKWGKAYAKKEFAIARASELEQAVRGTDFATEKTKLADKIAGEVEKAVEAVAVAEKAARDRAARAKTDAGKLEKLQKCAGSIAKSKCSEKLKSYTASIERKSGALLEALKENGTESLDELDKILAKAAEAKKQEELAKAYKAVS